jgi:DNA-binding GntR family transcriptional regulator
MSQGTARESAAVRAYAHTKSAILSGTFAGGTIVSEGDVAGALGVSRTPVREAFLRLEAEGWLRLFPKRGALVVPVLDGERHALLEARLLVEGHAAARACDAAVSARDAAEAMRACLAAQEDAWHAGDVAEFAHQDALFHQALVERGRNPLLATFYRTLQERQERMTRGSVRMSPATAAAILAEHRELADLVEAQHADDFAVCLERHLAAVYGELG